MSDDDRALLELARRRGLTPPAGVPTGEFDVAQPTPPPSDVEDLIGQLWPLRHAGNLFAEHAAKLATLEERTTTLQKLAGGLEEIGDTREEMREGFADLRGAKGDNGKVGELRRRVDWITSKAWLVLTAAFGAAGALAVKIVIVVRAFSELESRAMNNTAQIQVLQAQVMTLQTALITKFHPAETPGKDSP